MTKFSFSVELTIKELDLPDSLLREISSQLFISHWPWSVFDGLWGACFGWSSCCGREGWFKGSMCACCGGGGRLRQTGSCNGYSFTPWALTSLCSTVLTSWLLTTCFLHYTQTYIHTNINTEKQLMQISMDRQGHFTFQISVKRQYHGWVWKILQVWVLVWASAAELSWLWPLQPGPGVFALIQEIFMFSIWIYLTLNPASN